jgi:hypothetical protein
MFLASGRNINVVSFGRPNFHLKNNNSFLSVRGSLR